MPHRLRCQTEPDAAADYFGKILELLRALQIDEIAFSLNGSGDSGETNLDHVRYRDGTEATDIPEIPIGIDAVGRPAMLGYSLSEFAAELPDGNWCDNEGGYGTVTIEPFAEDCPYDCDMTYRQDGDWGDDEEPDDELEAFVLDPPGASAHAVPTVIIVGEVRS